MLIGARLRQLREQKEMRLGDIENRTGLPISAISRIENGRTIPSLETVERFAAVLEVPFYQLFLAGDEAPSPTSPPPKETLEELTGDNCEKGPDAQFLLELRNLVSRLTESDRDAILSLAKTLAAR